MLPPSSFPGELVRGAAAWHWAPSCPRCHALHCHWCQHCTAGRGSCSHASGVCVLEQVNAEYGARSFLNGKANPGENVMVTFNGKSKFPAVADANGDW